MLSNNLHMAIIANKLVVSSETFVRRGTVPSRSALLMGIFAIAMASIGSAADGLAKPRTNGTPQGLPVTHVLRREYQSAAGSVANGSKVTESKFKDVTGRTVSTAYTQGNMTTHKDSSGRIIGYSFAVNGKSKFYDTHGRPVSTN
jgi:hypothetical protein